MNYQEYMLLARREIESLPQSQGVVYQEVYDEQEAIADIVLRDAFREFWMTVYLESDDLSVAMITLEMGKWCCRFNPCGEDPDFVDASLRYFRSLLRGESWVVEVHSGSTWMGSKLVAQLADAELIAQAPSWNPYMTDKITHLNVISFGHPTRVITL